MWGDNVVCNSLWRSWWLLLETDPGRWLRASRKRLGWGVENHDVWTREAKRRKVRSRGRTPYLGQQPVVHGQWTLPASDSLPTPVSVSCLCSSIATQFSTEMPSVHYVWDIDPPGTEGRGHVPNTQLTVEPWQVPEPQRCGSCWRTSWPFHTFKVVF